MTEIILHPDQEDVLRWGTLAHVSKEERDRILAQPFHERVASLKFIAAEVQKKRKRPWTR